MQLQFHIKFQSLTHEKDLFKLEPVPGVTIKIIREKKTDNVRGHLKVIGLFSLVKERLRTYVTAGHK